MHLKLWYVFIKQLFSYIILFFRQKIPGVVAFLSAKDIPGANNFTPPEMEPGAEAELIFAETEVLFHNQPIGIILAETMEIANYASNFVEVTYKHQGRKFFYKKFPSLINFLSISP